MTPDQELWRKGIDLRNARDDKQWSLTDCISFVVIQDWGIAEALTGGQWDFGGCLRIGGKTG